ncbi:MAG TPA: hypothetical protein VIN09_01695 [Chloroflexota bacterium]
MARERSARSGASSKGARTPRSDGAPARLDADRGRWRERLLDLAYDASSYLRRHPQPAVRVSAALLLAASLAACDAGELPPIGEQPAVAVQPLAQEVRVGLPTAPGRYEVDVASLARDAQGVYHFTWRAPGGAWNPASTSLLRLARADQVALEVPQEGDPILYLPESVPIALRAESPSPTPTATSDPSVVVPVGSLWYPFWGLALPFDRPAYYDPPRPTVSDGDVRGARVSTAPRPLPERTIGLPHAVSGRAGGTGSGTAATMKSGAGAAKSTLRAPASSSFSGGKSGVLGGSLG